MGVVVCGGVAGGWWGWGCRFWRVCWCRWWGCRRRRWLGVRRLLLWVMLRWCVMGMLSRCTRNRVRCSFWAQLTLPGVGGGCARRPFPYVA